MTEKPIWIAEVEPTAIGPVWVGITQVGLAAVEFADSEDECRAALDVRGYDPVTVDAQRCSQAVSELLEFLEGKRHHFDLEIDWRGMTPFQEQVLRATYEIPYSEVRSYGQLAAQVGKPGAGRAVGNVQADNPMALVIPCHRVIGSDGKLHGYGGRGGLSTKAWLLAMESCTPFQQIP